MSAPSVTQREFAQIADCDEKQVRRAIKSGKLKLDAAGGLDPALANSGWRRPIRSSKAVADKSKVSAQVSAESVRTDEIFHDDDSPAQAAAKIIVALGAEHALAEAIRLKENYNALLKQLEYEQKAGSLVDLETAQQVFFEVFRAQRDTWLNWPTKCGPEIAADLGLEADKVTEILTTYVHRQITQLGQPDPSFAEHQG